MTTFKQLIAAWRERRKQARQSLLRRQAEELIQLQSSPAGEVYVVVAGIRVRHVAGLTDDVFDISFDNLAGYLQQLKTQYIESHEQHREED